MLIGVLSQNISDGGGSSSDFRRTICRFGSYLHNEMTKEERKKEKVE
jgi:hypothetical protein